MDTLLAVIERETGISRAKFLSDSRLVPIVRARYVLVYVLSQVYGLGTTDIGKRVGRIPQAINHNLKTIENLRETDTEFEEIIQRVVADCPEEIVNEDIYGDNEQLTNRQLLMQILQKINELEIIVAKERKANNENN